MFMLVIIGAGCSTLVIQKLYSDFDISFIA